MNISMNNGKHVLIIGVDGIRSDLLQLNLTEWKQTEKFPHFRSLAEKGATAFNHFYDETKQETYSGPGWTTIFTGTWANHHETWDNTYVEKKETKDDCMYNHEIPTIFNYVRNLFPESEPHASCAEKQSTVASLVDWKPLALMASYDYQGKPADEVVSYQPMDDSVEEYDKGDDLLHEAMKQILLRKIAPRLTFWYIGKVDEIGHHNQFSLDNAEYLRGLEEAAQRIDEIVPMVDARRTESGEEWLIVMTTDHGGHPSEKGGLHGSQAWTDRQCFAVFQNPSKSCFSGGKILDTHQGQTCIVPTILDFLDPQGFDKARYPSVVGTRIGSAPIVTLMIRFLKIDATDEYEMIEGDPIPASNKYPWAASISDQPKLPDQIQKLNETDDKVPYLPFWPDKMLDPTTKILLRKNYRGISSHLDLIVAGFNDGDLHVFLTKPVPYE